VRAPTPTNCRSQNSSGQHSVGGLTKWDRVDRRAVGAQDLTTMKLEQAVSRISTSVPPERLVTYSRLW